MSSGAPRPSLDEARARLKELGYLRGRVERFVLRRSLEGGSAFFVAVLAAGAIALSLSPTAAVASSQLRYAGSPRGIALLFLELVVVGLLPAGLFATALSFAAARSRRPGRHAGAFALAGSAGVLALWLVYPASAYLVGHPPLANAGLEAATEANVVHR